MANSEIFNKNHNDSTDIWDDTALIKMYEDSIKPSMPAVRTWNVGDKCVAQYAEDELWYKGTITKISGTVANVLFDGYEEEPEAEVELSDLADFIENEEDESNTENEEVANSLQSHNLPSNVRENPLGAVFGSSGQNFLPPFAPPPPPVFKNLTQPDEIEALSSMLMSWYMSGYHTGCYVTMMNHSGIGNDDIITLISWVFQFPSSDHQKVIIEAKALEKSITLSQLYGNIAMDSMEIPLNKIAYATLQKVAIWLTHSYNIDVKSALKIKKGEPTPDLPEWDKAFFDELNNTELLALVQAAEYLLIEELLEMGCRVIANKLREAKNISKIRNEWDVNPGWTKQEEAQIKRDLRWCYDP